MRRVLLTAVLLTALPALAGWGDFEREFEADKPWVELQAQLPAAPKPETLQLIDMGPVSPHRHLLDTASLSVGEDGVVRYAMVVRTAGGAENISFEGMRCATGERKLYAFGRADGQWARNRYARWEPIPARQEGHYLRELFFHYFCAGGEGAPTLGRIRQLLREGGYYPK